MVATQEQNYELTLSETLKFNIIFSLVCIFIFPLMRRGLPKIFAPQSHLRSKNNGFFGFVFWFIDVFRQPLSVYATRGNLACIFAVFCFLLLILYAFITLLSLTILIPTYYYGTDHSWTTNYLTFWSKITIAHLDYDSIMNIVPIFTVAYITIATLLFYHQFAQIYLFFRQRSLHRVIPQNFVVLIQNLPAQIDMLAEAHKVLAPIAAGVRAIVPVPKKCSELTSMNNAMIDLTKKLEATHKNVQDYRANAIHQSALMKSYAAKRDDRSLSDKVRSQMVASFKKAKAQNEKLSNKALNCMEQFGETVMKQRELRMKIMRICFEDKIEYEYLYHVRSLTPEMPSLIHRSFDFLLGKGDNRVSPCTTFNRPTMVSRVNQQLLDNLIKQKEDLNNDGEATIGSAVFLVCESQEVAAEKYTALIANDSKKPEASLAPNPNEIIWKNVGRNVRMDILYQILFVILLIALFIAYLYGQTKLMGLLNMKQIPWTEAFMSWLSGGKCKTMAENDKCSFSSSIASMLVTMIPTMTYCILMGFLPKFLEMIIQLLGYPSLSKNKDLLNKILFVFLILIMGVIQIVFPQVLDVEKGSFNIQALRNINFQDFILQIGRSLIDTQFTFINYIINKYLTFPIFSLLNFYGLFVWAMALLRSNSLDYNFDLRTITLNFPKELAYMCHMFVISFVFCITAPVTNVIVFVTCCLFVAIDLYFILFMVTPTLMSDLSSQSNMMLNVISTIFMGLVFMLVFTGAYFIVQGNAINTFGVVVCIICLFCSIWFKLRIDSRYKRALSELARGNFEEVASMAINPAHVPDEYEPKENYKSRYNLGNSADVEQASKLLKRDALTYKQSIADKMLERVYVDLTKLPISLVRTEDTKRDDFTCRLLTEPAQTQHYRLGTKAEKLWYTEHMKDDNGQQRGYDQEEIDIMAAYTHPALQRVFVAQE